ncbi:MAG: pirin family protein [Myxococcales bacterium]
MGDLVLAVEKLSLPWQTPDPFLFCMHHDDAYPAGDERMAPRASLEGREIGNDFAGKDGWRMYHGEVVPGFPQHPHRGFETVTMVRRGFIDHSDSLGAAARFGAGDVQWITAGKGIVHSEMFPLIERDRGNPLELFQIWVNLPRRNKLVEPHFQMQWREAVPVVEQAGTKVTLVAGALGAVRALAPPPESWAADPRSGLAIWTLSMAPGAAFTLPAAPAGVNRTLYFFRGSALTAAGGKIPPGSSIALRAGAEIPLLNGPDQGELLLLQGRPIGEPVAQYGPFVMTTRDELVQAFADYRQTGFGGWPWPGDGPVHARNEGRFARYPDGRIEKAG